MITQLIAIVLMFAVAVIYAVSLVRASLPSHVVTPTQGHDHHYCHACRGLVTHDANDCPTYF